MNPWLIIAALLAIAGSGVGGFFFGKSTENDSWEAKVQKGRADAEKDARDKEHMWQGVVNGAVENFTKKVNTIAVERDIALRKLRDRPERPEGMPQDSRANCKGASGPELARSNAEFLEWYAAKAAKQDAALAACYQLLDSMSGSLDRLPK